MPDIDEREILDVIRAIEAGTVTVTKSDPWDYHDNDCPVFTTSNGWRFAVFNDANEWDYFESVTAPDGRTISYDDFFGVLPTVERYWPKSIEALKRWGFDEAEAQSCMKTTLRAKKPPT